MQVDKFTKIVLTVIAVNLSIIVLKDIDILPKAHASNADDPIVMKPTTVPETKYGLVPLNEDGSINVKLVNSEELDVNITGVETSEELNINIDEIGGSYISSYGGTLPISIKSIETSDELDVNIEEVGGSHVFSKIPVKVD